MTSRRAALLPLLLASLLLARPAAAPAGVVAPVVAPRAWGPVVSGVAASLSVEPGLAGSPATASLLGRVNLELGLKPGSADALAFVAELPAGAVPESLAALPEASRVAVVAKAVAAVAARDQARAAELLARKDSLAREEAVELAGLSRRWFYLEPETAAEVRAAASREAERRTTGLAARIARALKGETQESSSLVVGKALEGVFAGAEKLVQGAPAEGRLTASVLAPYAARALDEAEARAVERGVPAGKVYEAVATQHPRVFGALAPRSLFKALRARGEWTELAAAMSLHSLERLPAVAPGSVGALAAAAEGDDLRLPIPEWHPLFGRYPSIAHWIVDAHGKPDDSAELKKSWPLYTAFGIPVRVERNLVPVLALGAWYFAPMLAGSLLLGAATVILLYLSVLAHEYGHAAAARLFGIRTRYIVMNWMGGGAAVVRGFRQSLPEFVIALAGPLVSALCGLAALALVPAMPVAALAAAVKLVGSMNLVLAAINLAPLFPMDGGRVLRALLTRPLGSYRATKVASFVGIALSLLLVWNGAGLLLAGDAGAGLMRMFFGFFLASGSRAMGMHPGTRTIDESPSWIR